MRERRRAAECCARAPALCKTNARTETFRPGLHTLPRDLKKALISVNDSKIAGLTTSFSNGVYDSTFAQRNVTPEIYRLKKVSALRATAGAL